MEHEEYDWPDYWYRVAYSLAMGALFIVILFL